MTTVHAVGDLGNLTEVSILVSSVVSVSTSSFGSCAMLDGNINGSW